MWDIEQVDCGCHIKVGRIEDVGTATEWAVTPTCSFAEPLSGNFDEHGRGILDGTGEVVYQPCQCKAEYRVVLDGGPMVNPSDHLVCTLHLTPRRHQLEVQARELSAIFCSKCFKYSLNLTDFPSEEVCSCGSQAV